MLNWLRICFRDKRFPLVVKDYWYCGAWYLYRGKCRDEGIEPQSPAEGVVTFDPFTTGIIWENDKQGLIDGLIPAIRIGDTVGLYEWDGCKYGRGRGYCGAAWDDGYKITLRFVRTVKAESVG